MPCMQQRCFSTQRPQKASKSRPSNHIITSPVVSLPPKKNHYYVRPGQGCLVRPSQTKQKHQPTHSRDRRYICTSNETNLCPSPKKKKPEMHGRTSLTGSVARIIMLRPLKYMYPGKKT